MLQITIEIRVYIRGNKNWYAWKVIAYGGYFYFAPDAAENFLERELGMKRGVSGGAIPPHPFPPMVAKLGLKRIWEP